MGIVRKETRNVVVLATLALALLLGWNAGLAKADGDEEGFGGSAYGRSRRRWVSTDVTGTNAPS